MENSPNQGVKVCEAVKREELFSHEGIESVLSLKCSRSKESYSCPNKMDCRDVYSRSEGPTALRRLRSLIWRQNPGSEVAPTLAQRRVNFVNLLKSMSRTKENRIVFCFEGKIVCKSFFRVGEVTLYCMHLTLSNSFYCLSHQFKCISFRNCAAYLGRALTLQLPMSRKELRIQEREFLMPIMSRHLLGKEGYSIHHDW